MATEYSPEELAYLQERTANKESVSTQSTPQEQARIVQYKSNKSNKLKDSNPTTLANTSDVSTPEAAPINYGSLVKNVIGGYEDVKKNAPSVVESLDTSMPWLKYVVGGLGIGLSALGLHSLHQRKQPSKTAEQPRVEPSFNEPPPPPAPPGGGTKQNFPQGDVTDVAVREVGQPRAQLTGPTPVTPTAPTSTPSIVPSTATTGVAPTFQPQNNAGYSLNPQNGYSATTLNQPTGVPSPVAGGAPAPAEAAPAPVKPLDPVAQARVEAIAAEQRRKDAADARAAEAHAAEQRRRDEIHELNKAKAAETKIQQSQGKASSQTSTAEQVLQAKALSEKNARDKAITAELKTSNAKPLGAPAPAVTPAAVTPPATPTVTPPATATPSVTPTTAPAPEVAPAATTPATTPPAATTPATPETVGKKPPKWPGGAEGSAVQQLFGGTKKTLEPKHLAALELFKDYVGGPLTMPASGGSIHQIDKANSFVEKYSGAPLPRTEDGKLARLPESQIKDIHAGINNELTDAVKNGKLGTLSKGALAAITLLGLTGAVNAAQKGDFGPLREAGFDIGGPVAAGKLGLGLLSKAGGLGFSALTYAGNAGEANEKAQVAKRFAESQKLGSPYRSVPPPR